MPSHDIDLMDFSLRFHIQFFQLVEDLLKVHAVFGQNKDRLVDGGQADFGLPFGLEY